MVGYMIDAFKEINAARLYCIAERGGFTILVVVVFLAPRHLAETHYFATLTESPDYCQLYLLFRYLATPVSGAEGA